MGKLLAAVAVVLMLGVGVGVRAQDAATPQADATPGVLYCATPLADASASPVSTVIAADTAATPGGSAPGEEIGLYPCGTPAGSPVASPAADTTGGTTASAPQAVDMVDIAYTQTALTIPANTDVVINLTNKGVLVHNFNVDELNVHSGDYASQQAGSVTINAAPGTYQFYCSVPGHKDIGMVGTLTVQ